MNPWENGTYLTYRFTDKKIKHEWIVGKYTYRLSHGWYGIFVESLSINWWEEFWRTSLFVFVPFCWVSVHIQVENRSLLWGLWSFKMDGWEDENRVTHILFIQLAWYQHDTQSDVVEDMLFQVNLLSISWYRLQQLLLGCVCVCGGTSLFTTVLQKFKDFTGRSKTHRTPYLHCPCKL